MSKPPLPPLFAVAFLDARVEERDGSVLVRVSVLSVDFQLRRGSADPPVTAGVRAGAHGSRPSRHWGPPGSVANERKARHTNVLEA